MSNIKKIGYTGAKTTKSAQRAKDAKTQRGVWAAKNNLVNFATPVFVAAWGEVKCRRIRRESAVILGRKAQLS